MLYQQVNPLSDPTGWAGQFVDGDRVHSDIYTSPAVFAREMEKIFHSTWVYVAHESEIPKAGDFVTRRIGSQPIIAVRGDDGVPRLLMNRCRHRGTIICEIEHGNQSHFRCFYHGWTYENTGKLIHIPHDDAYSEEFKREDHSLTPVPRFENYRGFIFGSLNPNVGSLRDQLGLAAGKIDFMIDASPTGVIELDEGIHKTSFGANWKFVGMDGYHPPIVHLSAFEIIKRNAIRQAGGADSKTAQAPRKTMGDSELAVSRDLGNGHVMLDVIPHRISELEHHLAAARRMEDGDSYVDAMFKAYGPTRGGELIAIGGDPHLGIFPNMQLINQHVRLIQPISVDRTEVILFPVRLGGVSDSFNELRLRRHEEFYGPAGFGQPDDSEIFERAQEGLKAKVDPWIDLSRGRHRERVDSDGTIIGHITDEVTARGQMREWSKLMNAS
jgi:phenylpropionate dioxygenase-like ring-hydroxylating dioxygenase large terminal subunit